MADYIDENNPDDDLENIQREGDTEVELTELQIEVALNRKLQDNRDKAIVKLNLMLDLFSTLEDKIFYSNKINEIINDLN